MVESLKRIPLLPAARYAQDTPSYPQGLRRLGVSLGKTFGLTEHVPPGSPIEPRTGGPVPGEPVKAKPAVIEITAGFSAVERLLLVDDLKGQLCNDVAVQADGCLVHAGVLDWSRELDLALVNLAQTSCNNRSCYVCGLDGAE
ncbi:MAG: hypothetical protein RLZZ304_189 [Actinomycetota bacterium]|jgi:hypothetical protein